MTTTNVVKQSKPSAATLTDLYTVGAATSSMCSTITVCNQSATATAFRISVAPGGVADATSQYLYYDIPIPGNNTFAATLGFALATTDKVRVYATLATLSFSLFVQETT
jgi:hypothetical protein